MLKSQVRGFLQKYTLWLLAVLVIAGGTALGSYAVADDGSDTRLPSIDAVILIDQSNSMTGTKTIQANDSMGYRFDAAQILISMCDMDGSRVAFVPFAGTLVSYKNLSNEFVDISDSFERQSEMLKIDALRNESGRSDTDLGQALSYAVWLLMERDNKDNNPMIIALTDGKNYLNSHNSGSVNKYVYEWSDEENDFVSTKYSNGEYDTDKANELMDKAAKVAAANDIPIYTVALLDNNDEDSESNRTLENNLRKISDLTNAKSKSITSANASELPEFFGDMFATQVGSSIQHTLTPKEVEGEPGKYEVILPILNESVLEANIYVPLDGIQNIRLYKPNDDTTDYSGGSTDVVSLSSTNFRFFKIISPKTLGDWRLVFELEDTTDLSSISFSLLYNYNITLKTQLGTSQANMGSPDEGLTAGKGDTLEIVSRFYTSDGTPSQDINLYKVQTGDDWETIRCTYELHSANSDVTLCTGTMQNDYDSFNTSIDLKKLLTDDDGFNNLTTGDYELVIKADGAGLSRENTLALSFTNNPPQAADGTQDNELTRYIEVDNPDDETTLEPQTVSFDLNELITDPDNDKLYYQLQPADGATKILPLTLDEETGIIQGETIRDPETGMFCYGDAKYTLTVLDNNAGQDPVTWQITLKVVSIANQNLNNFTCVTSTTGFDETTKKAEKNSQITFSMHLVDTQTSTPDTAGEIRNYNGQVDIVDASNTNMVLASIPMTLNEQETELSAAFETYDFSQSFIAYCTYTYSQYSDRKVTQPVSFYVDNVPPEVVQATLDEIPEKITYDPLPVFLSFLEQTTAEETLQVPLNKLFTDADNELGLVYEDPQFATEDEDTDPTTLMSFTRTGDSVQLVPTGEGPLTITFTAIDGDSESTPAVRSVEVSSVLNKWKRIGLWSIAGLIALILIIIIAYQLHKPYFASDTVLVIREKIAIFASDTRELPRTKKVLQLSNYVDLSIAERNGIMNDHLASIQIKPKRSSDGSIYVRRVKSMPSFYAQIGGVAVRHSYMVWGMDQELTLEVQQGDPALRIQLSRSQSPMYSGSSDGFDQNSGFGDPGMGFGNDSFSTPPFQGGGFGDSDF